MHEKLIQLDLSVQCKKSSKTTQANLVCILVVASSHIIESRMMHHQLKNLNVYLCGEAADFTDLHCLRAGFQDIDVRNFLNRALLSAELSSRQESLALNGSDSGVLVDKHAVINWR